MCLKLNRKEKARTPPNAGLDLFPIPPDDERLPVVLFYGKTKSSSNKPDQTDNNRID